MGHTDVCRAMYLRVLYFRSRIQDPIGVAEFDAFIYIFIPEIKYKLNFSKSVFRVRHATGVTL